MLTIWDNNPEKPHTAIRNYLSHVQLNGLLENTKIVHVSFNGDEPKPGFYFEIPKDPTKRYNPNRYNITTMNILYQGNPIPNHHPHTQ